jgi:hypothetical protein
MNELSKAIWKLRPTAEFSYNNDDYSTIQWTKLNEPAPTQAEINTAIEQIRAQEANAEATAEIAKAAAQAKLAALGLTTDDLKALGL